MTLPKEIFMTTKEVARYLSVSASLLEQLRCRNGGPPYYKLGGKVLYKKSEIDIWFEAHRKNPEDQTNG